MGENKFLQAKQLFEANDLAGSLRILDDCISAKTGDKNIFGLRARIRFKQQDWGGAMNDFLSVLDLEPENNEAKTGLEMTQNILGYFNSDLYNP